MIKNFSHLYANVEGKDFQFNLEHGTSFAQIKEALFQFQKQIGSIEDQAKAQQEKAEADKKALEENKTAEVVE